MNGPMKTQSIICGRAPEPVGPYPHAKRVGPFVFVSGMGPRQRGGADIPGVRRDASGAIVDYDIAAQTRAVFENVRMVLEEAGTSWGRIVDVLVFLTNMKRDFKAYNEVYRQLFPNDQPARTTVEIGALPTEIAIEVKVIATIE